MPDVQLRLHATTELHPQATLPRPMTMTSARATVAWPWSMARVIHAHGSVVVVPMPREGARVLLGTPEKSSYGKGLGKRRRRLAEMLSGFASLIARRHLRVCW